MMKVISIPCHAKPPLSLLLVLRSQAVSAAFSHWKARYALQRGILWWASCNQLLTHIALLRELPTMCSFLQACYLQIATVIELDQLKSGNELSCCFGASIEIKELQGRFGVWLINQLHLWDSKGLPKELRRALQERGK